MTKGKTIGYKRVSTIDQNLDRQLEGIKLDKVFIDKVSGSDINRPELSAMLDYVREDDMIIVHSIDRLARNLDDLRRIVDRCIQNKITIKFLKENLTFDNSKTALSNLLLSVMGAFAEFERSLIKERQMEGIALAKMKGVYKGRKKVLNDEQLEIIKQRVAAGEKKTAIAKDMGVSRDVIYKYLYPKI